MGKRGPKPGSGAGGRPKGSLNKITTTLKDAILEAASEVGYDGHGQDGLQGYLRKVASDNMKSFSGLLGRILPLQIGSDPLNPIKHDVSIHFVSAAKEKE